MHPNGQILQISETTTHTSHTAFYWSLPTQQKKKLPPPIHRVGCAQLVVHISPSSAHCMGDLLLRRAVPRWSPNFTVLFFLGGGVDLKCLPRGGRNTLHKPIHYM